MPKPFQMQPSMAGSTLRLATFMLEEVQDICGIERQAAELEGEVCGYVLDRERPELVTVQIAEGHPLHDVAWARRTLVKDMARSSTALRVLADGSTVYQGKASHDPVEGQPFRWEFFLVFSAEDGS